VQTKKTCCQGGAKEGISRGLFTWGEGKGKKGAGPLSNSDAFNAKKTNINSHYTKKKKASRWSSTFWESAHLSGPRPVIPLATKPVYMRGGKTVPSIKRKLKTRNDNTPKSHTGKETKRGWRLRFHLTSLPWRLQTEKRKSRAPTGR